MKPSTPEFVTQHFPTDYIDKRFMLQWLKSTFGEHFYAEIQNCYYKVQAPRKITEDELDYIKNHKHYASNFEENSSNIQ